MKSLLKSKIIKYLLLLTLLLSLALSASGCGLLTIYVKEGGGFDSNSAPSGVVNVTETFDKVGKVISVDFKTSNEGNVFSFDKELSAIEATDKVYESVVTVKASYSNGTSIGSGVIADVTVKYDTTNPEYADYNGRAFAYILTCFHVIEDSKAINVYIPKLEDETTGKYTYYDYVFGATLMGGDKEADLAVLRIEINDAYAGFSEDKLVKAALSVTDLKRGQDIFAIGNPLGVLPGGVSYGKVSNLYVSISVKDIGEMSLHQTDTATNSGNSGGGIFNLAGQLVGILNAGADGYDGLSFFIPATGNKGIKIICEALLSTVDYNYGYIEGKWSFGATLSDMLFSAGYTRYYSVYFATVISSGLVAEAGIKANYVLRGLSYVDGSETKTLSGEFTSSQAEAFIETMQSKLKIGDRVTIVYSTDFRSQDKTVVATISQYIYTP